MRRKLIFLLVLLVASATANATFQNPATEITNRASYITSQSRAMNPVYKWCNEAEGLVSAGVGLGTGKTWYVNSGASGTAVGTSWTNAAATIDAAINLCSADSGANRGDQIRVAQKHAETIAAANGFDLDVAGVTIIFEGNPGDMGTLTFTATASDVAIGAANCSIIGGRFLAGISEVVRGVSVEATADDCAIIGAIFPEPTTSTFEFDKAILVAAGADRFRVEQCRQLTADATGATNFLDLDTGIQNGTQIYGNILYGEYAEGAIHSDDIDLDVEVWYNNVTNLTSGQHGIEFTAAALGTYGYNWVFTDAEATSIDPGSLKAVAPSYVQTAVDAGPAMYPTIDTQVGTTDAKLGGFSGDGGAAQDDSVKASLDLVNTDTALIVADTAAMQPIQEYSIKASIATVATGEDILFTVAGGPVKIVEIVGIVTGIIQAQSTLINYNVAVTTPAGDVPFGTDGTALEINGDAAGTLYTWNGVIANDLVATTAGVALGLASGTTTGLIVPPGDIELSSTAASTGTIDFYMRYIPMGPSSVVTAP